jgi:hypothetical protein
MTTSVTAHSILSAPPATILAISLPSLAQQPETQISSCSWLGTLATTVANFVLQLTCHSPEAIYPNPLNYHSIKRCPVSFFVDIHHKRSSTEPFLDIVYLPDVQSGAHDVKQAMETLRRLEEFDGHTEQVFTVFAHDATLMDVVEFFPRSSNQWKTKGWAEKGRWRFWLIFKKRLWVN